MATIQPCHCGYEGMLMGTQHQGLFFSLTCPGCRRTVEAFTLEGLTERWNKPAAAALVRANRGQQQVEEVAA